jgi:ABC-2 type transport system permease protein
MAELGTSAPPERWSVAQTRSQYAAITWLRWRIFVNNFRRKGGTGDLVARIITYPIATLFLIGPTIGAGLAGYFIASHAYLQYVFVLLWAIFGFTQVLNINLGQAGTSFNPIEFIRFPMSLRSFVVIRLFFGLMAPANIVAVAMSVAVAVGISIAVPSLLFLITLAMLVFAATNVLFTRMVFAWIDRWMSTRRAREVFTAIIFIGSLGIQYVNVTYNAAFSRHHRDRAAYNQRLENLENAYSHIKPVQRILPPGLIGEAVIQANQGHPLMSVLETGGCVLYAGIFLAVFGLRMRAEFEGESLSDTANAVAPVEPTRPIAALATFHAETTILAPAHGPLGLPPTIGPLFAREFLYLRRNTGMFYGLIAPIVMVLLFAGKLATRHNAWYIFPAALGYTMMGLAPLAYNVFGLEGAGSQFFFLAPVRMREILLAKNFMTLMVAVIEGFAVFAIVSYLGEPPTVEIALVALLWAVGTMLFSIAVGNYRSIGAPKKINLNRTAGKQASPLSALLSLGIVILAAGFGAGMLAAGRFLNLEWLVIPTMLLYAAASIITYVLALRAMDGYALSHREAMFEELCKAS